MKREFDVVIERDEDGFYVASVPALRGCHTQAKSLDTLMKRVKEAIELYLESKPKKLGIWISWVSSAYAFPREQTAGAHRQEADCSFVGRRI